MAYINHHISIQRQWTFIHWKRVYFIRHTVRTQSIVDILSYTRNLFAGSYSLLIMGLLLYDATQAAKYRRSANLYYTCRVGYPIYNLRAFWILPYLADHIKWNKRDFLLEEIPTCLILTYVRFHCLFSQSCNLLQFILSLYATYITLHSSIINLPQ